ncbi:DUF1499 domain-containing protein [Aureliella helgolandensis]|uniref:DUF1499 domain-containing protein n=1 Tax=Aureliella helgolandensis TaxID=2527968 RepID=A0A518G0E1_9BACT|nr:DUF1499 domain-containing protein [Aureliella helgolandensis]QDV22061.1 hypothetical protein Q31a_03400 [Aureliella helgolandensis]
MNTLLASCPDKPNCVSSQATRAEQAMPPLHFSGDHPQALEAVVTLLSSMPRVKLVERQANSLHFTFTSLVLRFVDDVEFAIAPDTQLLHFRSASRLGYSDLGANRKRMTMLCEQLCQQGIFTLAPAPQTS